MIKGWRVFNDGRFEACELPEFPESLHTWERWAEHLGYKRSYCNTSCQEDPSFGLEVFDRKTSMVPEAHLVFWWDRDDPVVFAVVDAVALARLQALYLPIVQAVETSELNQAAQRAFFAWHCHDAEESCRRCEP